MPKRLHNKVRTSLRKAHPTWSDAKLDDMTDRTLATIAARSAKKGSYPGPRRSSSTRRPRVRTRARRGK